MGSIIEEAMFGNIDKVKIHLDEGVSPLICDENGKNLLSCLITSQFINKKEKERALKKMLKERLDWGINSVDNDGYSVLQRAFCGALNGRITTKTVRLLVEHGAYTNLRNSEGDSLHMIAYKHNRRQLGDLLLLCQNDSPPRNNQWESASAPPLENDERLNPDFERLVPSAPPLEIDSMDGRVSVPEEESLEFELECHICMDEYQLDEPILKCGCCHKPMCKNCQKNIMAGRSKAECPFCRALLANNQLRDYELEQKIKEIYF